MELLALLPAPLHSYGLKDLTHEEWRDVVGHEEYYQISSLGRLKRKARRTMQRYNWMIHKEKIVRTRLYEYVQSDAKINNRRYLFKIHRLIAMAFIPNPENKATVNHIDGVKYHNWIGNLEWATHKENVSHAVANGLTLKGEEIPCAKLKEADVIEIRSLHRNGKSMREIGRRFGICHGTVGDIIRYVWWKHVA